MGTEVPKPAGRNWTEAQLRGIRTTGHSLLVSAAAGSGKTAVLAERCAYLVCDAAEPCDVDELLVVTFTEAAAAEMKTRIGQALRGRASVAPSLRLTQQLALLDRASISTLHGFCSRLLRQHFHLVGLDPSFNVLDADDARLLRNDVARQLFSDRYELDADGQFQQLVDAYADGNDERLVRLVLQTHDMLGSLVDPDAWAARSLRRVADVAEAATLELTELGTELRRFVSDGLAAMAARCDDAIEQVGRLGDFRKYVDLLRDHRSTLYLWEARLNEAGIDALAAEVARLDLGRLPSVRNDIPNKDAAKATAESVRDAMGDGPWRDCLRFTSSEWRDGMRAVLPHARVFLALVEQFERRYRMAKDAARAVDFSDLERFALKALRDPAAAESLAPSPAARACHKRFRHVLVDEYQDINEVQDAILTLVSRECLRGEAGVETNLFSVGDVKQSIYRFRLAEPTRFLERERAFRSATGAGPTKASRQVPGEVIDLQANFRSRAPLLDAINLVFERLMVGDATDITYDASHRLRAGKTFPQPGNGVCCFTGAPIELHVLPKKFDRLHGAGPDAGDPENCDEAEAGELDRAEREALLVAHRIRQMLGHDGGTPTCVMESAGDGTMRPRPIRFGDIVILLRSMKHKAEEYAEILEASGIPVHSESSTGYFESMEVRDLLALLALLDNQRQDVPLAAFLRGPLAGMGRAEDAMARVRLAYPAGTESVPFHEAARRYAREKDDDLARWLRDFFARIARWRSIAQRGPLTDLLDAIYEDTGCLTYVAGLHDGRQRVANLLYLRERAAQFGSFHRQGLSRFLQFLESLREESDLGQPSVATEAQDVVRIMSVHRSKGLEFPVVFLPDLGKAINLQDCAGNILTDRRAGLGMAVVDDARKVRYPSLASMLVQVRLRQQALAEEMRVLYVAMTRAQEHLVLVGTAAEEAPLRWAARWAGHLGPLPADALLGASTLLDWIGPVAAAARSPDGGDVFRVTMHAPGDVAAWKHPMRGGRTAHAGMERLVRLEPLDPPPEPHPLAEEIARRLTTSYPHARFATAAAARSATEAPGGRVRGGALKKSALLDEELAAGPDAVGAATHLVLQHLDLSGACDHNWVAAEVGRLVDRRLLGAAVAARVDVESLVWFLSSDLGHLLRRHASDLRRELPVYAAVPVEGARDDDAPDPADRVMLRGRVDALLPLADRSILVDYKTDLVGPHELPARVASYQPQLAAYVDAVERATSKPASAKLVFLRARAIYDV